MKGGELFDRIVDKGHFTEQDAVDTTAKLLSAMKCASRPPPLLSKVSPPHTGVACSCSLTRRALHAKLSSSPAADAACTQGCLRGASKMAGVKLARRRWSPSFCSWCQR